MCHTSFFRPSSSVYRLKSTWRMLALSHLGLSSSFDVAASRSAIHEAVNKWNGFRRKDDLFRLQLFLFFETTPNGIVVFATERRTCVWSTTLLWVRRKKIRFEKEGKSGESVNQVRKGLHTKRKLPTMERRDLRLDGIAHSRKSRRLRSKSNRRPNPLSDQRLGLEYPRMVLPKVRQRLYDSSLLHTRQV